jgi:hypothetical protein
MTAATMQGDADECGLGWFEKHIYLWIILSE